MHTALSSVRALAAGIALLTIGNAFAPDTAGAQTGTLVGKVLVDGVERPIAGADVIIGATGLKARSDSVGRFTIANVPHGEHVVGVRALGFAPGAWKITFTEGERVEIDFLLTTTVQSLEKVEVKAKTDTAPTRISMRFTGFEERRALGLGRFITQDVMEKAGGRRLTDVLLSRIPGLSAVGKQQFLVSNRRVLKKDCFLRVLIDGVLQPVPFSTDGLDSSRIAGIEFHTISTTPPQFNATGTSPCGTLLIWLRG